MEFTGRTRSGRKTAQKNSAGQKSVRKPRKEKPLVLKKAPSPQKESQTLLAFPCKKPVRLSPKFSAKSDGSPSKTPSKTPAKTPVKTPAKTSAQSLLANLRTPEKTCDPPSSKRRSTRFAKSLKEVIEEAKKLQDSAHSEKPQVKEGDDEEETEVVQREAKTPKAGDFDLPEKYAMLGEFFDAMEAAIRLLKLRKTICTFGNIRPQVETMTHRRFMHNHVAKMKYILPEGLLLEKIMFHDERTLCMKADLKITLLHDALHSAKDRQIFSSASKASTSVLRKTFHSRLVEFVKSHPKGDDIPEEVLPEPFNKKCLPIPVKLNNDVSSRRSRSPPRSPIHEGHAQPTIMSSMLPKSFMQRFSQRNVTGQLSPSLSGITEQGQNLKPLEVPEAGISDGSAGSIPCSITSHFPAGFKSRFAAKSRPSGISEIESSPFLKHPDANVTHRFNQSEANCKVPEAKPVCKDATQGNTPCKTVVNFENTSSTKNEDCLSPTTKGVDPDSSPLKTVSLDSSAKKYSDIKPILKPSAMSPISEESLHFQNLRNLPDASPHVLPPQTPQSLSSPNSSSVSQSSEHRTKISNVRRAIAFNILDKKNQSSSACEKPLVCQTSLKRKAAESNLDDHLPEHFQFTKNSVLSTPAKSGATDSCADSVKHCTSSVAANPFVTSNNYGNAMNNPVCPFSSPTKTLSVEKIQEETQEKIILNTPPLHCPKRRRLNVDEAIDLQPKATQSCSQTCPPSFQSLQRSDIQPCKIDFERTSDASKSTDHGSGIQELRNEGFGVLSESEWEILKTLSPRLVHEVRERQLKNLENCRLGVLDVKRRQRMIACLPKLFNMIRDIFRSSKRSVITRQELVHKIISHHCDVIDRSEVEEQLQLLEELVPDWISGRTATSGDYLYSIKNNLDVQSIHKKLVSAL